MIAVFEILKTKSFWIRSTQPSSSSVFCHYLFCSYHSAMIQDFFHQANIFVSKFIFTHKMILVFSYTKTQISLCKIFSSLPK